ncbi:DUF305 domain-containing protein [Pseudonocardia nigra]|uniref:DUF305 domain-containing protein n=1 Tax=Pseudonocardia nigra TaxID=1921578 RepID=UPI0027E2A7F3|nr:DUF305 domain-containing protein [Pseudonocardia nigra]
MTTPTERTAPAGTSGDERPGGGGEARWVRPLLAVAAVLALLFLGAAGGILIGLPGSSSPAAPAPDSVDVGFAQDMTVHHQQGVQMAAWARDHTNDPVIAQLAADIETTQNSQIGRMQGWLSLWNASPLPLGEHMEWMAGPAHSHGDAGDTAAGVNTMPGMASEAELAALRAATGQEMDVLFLQLMLRHHQGGVGMMQYAAEQAAVPQVRNLAAQMLKSQQAESDYLRQLLAERGAEPLPL